MEGHDWLDDLNPSARLGLMRHKLKTARPEGFTPDMAQLLDEKLRRLEEVTSILEEMCPRESCMVVYEELDEMVSSIDRLVSAGDAGVFDYVDDYTKKLARAVLSSRARLRASTAAAAASGTVVALASISNLMLPTTVAGFYMALVSLALGLAAGLLSRYTLGSLLGVIGAIVLSVSTVDIMIVALAVAAAGLAGVSLAWRRHTIRAISWRARL